MPRPQPSVPPPAAGIPPLPTPAPLHAPGCAGLDDWPANSPVFRGERLGRDGGGRQQAQQSSNTPVLGGTAVHRCCRCWAGAGWAAHTSELGLVTAGAQHNRRLLARLSANTPVFPTPAPLHVPGCAGLDGWPANSRVFRGERLGRDGLPIHVYSGVSGWGGMAAAGSWHSRAAIHLSWAVASQPPPWRLSGACQSPLRRRLGASQAAVGRLSGGG